MSLLGNYLGVQVQALHDGIVKTVVNFDPEGASEAQLAEYHNKVDQLADIAAKAMTQAAADAARVIQLQASFDQHMKAAASLDGSNEPAKQKALEKIVSDAETISGDLESAKASAADSSGYADQMKAAHGQAVDKWKNGRTHLDQAKRDQERARQDAARAAQQTADAERAAGLIKGLNGGDIALDAMAANTARLKEKAASARLTSGALSTATEGDDEAAKALAAAAGTSSAAGSSLAERMAALRAKG